MKENTYGYIFCCYMFKCGYFLLNIVAGSRLLLLVLWISYWLLVLK